MLLSGSSLIDYISSMGLFSFIFRLDPAGPFPYTLDLSTLLLLFGNWSGRAMVDRHKGQAIPNISLGDLHCPLDLPVRHQRCHCWSDAALKPWV